jgi:hypothetical protein
MNGPWDAIGFVWVHSDWIGEEAMEGISLSSFIANLREEGFRHKAMVSDEEMEVAYGLLNSLPVAQNTSGEELRYIEGLLHLPLQHLEYFRVIPEEGYSTCACGRVPSALDLVDTALRQRIHSRNLIRDTLIGFSNVIELSDDGRVADCIRCGRAVAMRIYYTRRYMYAVVEAPE